MSEAPTWVRTKALDDDLRERLFDPPFLGMPWGANARGRAHSIPGGFVEIFLVVRQGRILDAGFLTTLGQAGLLCASLVCEALIGTRPGQAEEPPGLAMPAVSPAQEEAYKEAMAVCLKAARRAAADSPGASFPAP